MFNRSNQWRDRALVAEAANALYEAQLTALNEQLQGIELRFAEQASLISIVRDGRKIRFNFTRHGNLYSIEVMGTWDDDVDGWKRALLQPTIKETNDVEKT